MGWRGAGFVKIFVPEGPLGWDRGEKLDISRHHAKGYSKSGIGDLDASVVSRRNNAC